MSHVPASLNGTEESNGGAAASAKAPVPTTKTTTSISPPSVGSGGGGGGVLPLGVDRVMDAGPSRTNDSDEDNVVLQSKHQRRHAINITSNPGYQVSRFIVL